MSEVQASFHMAGPDTAFGVFGCECGLVSNPVLERKVIGGPLLGECTGCGMVIRYGTRDQLDHESEPKADPA
jgi:hypothetical protein